MKATIKIIALLLILFSCKLENRYSLKKELLEQWSVLDSAHIDFFNFNTIAQFDEFQYLHKELFDTVKVIIPVDGAGIELIREGDKLKNDLSCILPLPEKRIVRFEFTKRGDEVRYNGDFIAPEESKEIVKSRFSESNNPNQQIISFVFEDSIKSGFVLETVHWVNEGFIEFIANRLLPDTTLSYSELSPEMKNNLNKVRLVYGVGRINAE